MALMLFVLIINVYFLYQVKVNGNDRATFFGYAYQIGKNNSMHPTLKPNDFIITKEQSSYKVGDIITFVSKDTKKITTHRIVQITENGFITRGDYEFVSGDDKEITKADIIGKVVAVLPKGGTVLVIMKNPLGAFIIIAIIVVCFFLVQSLSKNKEEKKNNKN